MSKSEIIEDLKIEKLDIKNAKLEKFAKMLDTYKINIYDYLPKKPRSKVSFILNENSTFANFLRFAILDGTLVWGFKVIISSIVSNDNYLLFDHFEQIVQGVPLNQTFINEAYAKDGEIIYKKFKASLSVYNNSHDIKTITTHDIKFVYNGEIIENMCEMIPILYLMPGRQIYLELTLDRNYGYINANTFNSVSATEYKILDYKHMSEGGPSSLEYNPMKFYMSYTTARNYDDPLDIMRIILNDYTDRIKKLSDRIKIFDETKLTLYHEDEYEFRTYPNQTQYSSGETYFTVGLIVRTIYEMYPDIQLVNFDARHLLEHASIFTVQAEDANVKVIKACENILQTFEKLKKIINSYKS